jgi:hypothetical protein
MKRLFCKKNVISSMKRCCKKWADRLLAKRYEQREQTEPQQSRANLWQSKKRKKLMEEERKCCL